MTQQYTEQELAAWRGHDLIDRSGERVGPIDELYVDDRTGRLEWAAVKTGLLGTKLSFVPLAQASFEDDVIRVAHDQGQIKDAPGIDAEKSLSQAEEAELYAHYGLEYGESRSDSGLPEGGAGEQAGGEPGGGMTGEPGRDTSGPSTDDAMTRSEEEVRVGKSREERGRVRLRKYVVTEEVQQTVPVRREEVRVEREPVTDANLDRAVDGPAISEEEHEVVLHEEKPVVEKRVVPKERVRLEKDVVTDEAQVSEEVRKERIEEERGR